MSHTDFLYSVLQRSIAGQHTQGCSPQCQGKKITKWSNQRGIENGECGGRPNYLGIRGTDDPYDRWLTYFTWFFMLATFVLVFVPFHLVGGSTQSGNSFFGGDHVFKELIVEWAYYP